MRALAAKYILEITVFVCGAVVMIYEIIGSRIVSPFIGTSVYVWTSLIGVILASLSLGYWLGGRFADRRPDLRILSTVIFLAAGLISVTILVKDVILASVASMPAGLEIRSLVASLFLFAPASVALGFVAPYAVKLKTVSLADSGKTVGRLYALSTIGSIVGTFAAGFFLIPYVGSVRTLYLIAAALFALSLLLAPFALNRITFGALTVFFFGIVGSEATTILMRQSSELYDVDTEYSRVQIFRTTDPKTNRPMRALAVDPFSVQSAVYLDGDDLALRYTRFYHLVRYFRPEFRRSLMIGGAGYTFPRDYLRTYPDATLDVVEIDPGMTEIAREYFGLADQSRLNIIHEDGRVFLNAGSDGSYDAILMDAFGSLFSVPYHLTTLEAVANIHRMLDENGIVILNMGSAIRGPSSGFLQAELATYRSVFREVQVFKVNPDYSDERIQNVILVACKVVCPATTSNDPVIAELLSHRYTTEIPADKPVLTDDLAPIEHYNSYGQNLYRH
ncbi:MAG TPA: fused MFS/spermidine synthase [Pyrinomonadaceae bacterium]|nr:fused MFS/spermidine synthase [Pyrinomonadaceae bacterium]